MSAQPPTDHHRFLALLESRWAFITIIDAAGGVRYQSPAIQLALGYEPQALVGRRLYELLDPETIERVRERIGYVARAVATVEVLELRMRHANGSWRVMEAVFQNRLDNPRIDGIVVYYSDVTDRRHMEDALRMSWKHYCEIIDGMPLLIARFLPDTTLTFVNETHGRFFEQPIQDQLGRRFIEWAPPEMRDWLRAYFASFTRAQPLRSHDTILTRPNGERRWIRWTDRALFGAGDAPVEFQSTGEDITARKAMEEALQRRLDMEQLVAAVSTRFVNAPVGDLGPIVTDVLRGVGGFLSVERCYAVLLSDDETRVMDMYEWSADEAAAHGARIKGLNLDPYRWSREQIARDGYLHIPDMDLLPFAAREEQVLWRGLGVRSLVALPMTLNQATVGFFGVETKHAPRTFAEEDIRLLRMIGDVLAGVLARKRAHDALRASEEKYRLVVEKTPVLICRWRPDTTLTFVNDAYARYYGADRAALLGRKFLDFVPATEWEEAHRQVDTMRDECRFFMNEHTVELPGGEVRRLLWTNTPLLDAAGNVAEYQSIGEDITERQQRQMLDIAEREQRRIGQDLHDGLCQQIAGITMLCSGLRQRLTAHQCPEFARDAEEIEALLSDALLQARGLSRGLLPLPLDPAGLWYALDELARSITRMFHVACVFRRGAPVAIADGKAATHLYRIAQEATSNALRHGKAQRIELALTETEEAVRLTVQNDGEAFPVVAPSDGMGLAGMAFRARAMGGSFAIGPVNGHGALATCTVPKKRRPAMSLL